MDTITVNKGKLVIPKQILNVEYLMNNCNLTLPIVQKNGEDSPDLHGFTLEIRLNLNNPVKLIYNNLVSQFPELLNIIHKTFINYGEITFDNNIMLALTWIYKFYYNYNVVLFLPKSDILFQFNETFIKDQNYYISDKLTITVSLEALEQYEFHGLLKVPNVTIFAYSDTVFKSINQRRLNTQLKKILKKSNSIVHIFSFTSLQLLDIPCLAATQRYEFTTKSLINFDSMFDSVSLIDFLDSDPETFDSNVSDFIDLINESVSNNKRLYLSLNLSMDKLKSIEAKLKGKGIRVSRKDNPDSNVVINSSKTTRGMYSLKNNYSVFIMIFDNLDSPIDIIDYLKFIGNNEVEIYFDSSKMKNIEKCMKFINKTPIQNKIIIKDSDEYESYEECQSKCDDPEPVLINEYYSFINNESLQRLNLSNLSKPDYDIIRNYVKIKLMNKFDLDIKTCQLTTPCSPKDRPKKLNSLSNKINSFDYRCNVTCEIFKDYSIGVLVWNETFADRSTLDLNTLKDSVYIYQTTNGNWKYTSVK